MYQYIIDPLLQHRQGLLARMKITPYINNPATIQAPTTISVPGLFFMFFLNGESRSLSLQDPVSSKEYFAFKCQTLPNGMDVPLSCLLILS